MDIRQVAVVATALQPVQQQFFALLGVQRGFHDPLVKQFGLANVVMRLGECYLEVVAPVQEETTAGRFLQRRDGDGGYMVLVQVDDLAVEKARLQNSALRIVWEEDIGKARGIHLHPKDVPGAIASLDQMIPPDAWYWAGYDGELLPPAQHVTAITAAQVQSADPAHTAAQWSLAYGRQMVEQDSVLCVPFDNTEMRFVEATDGRGEGLQAVFLDASDLDAVLDAASQLSLPVAGQTVTVCGTLFHFQQQGRRKSATDRGILLMPAGG